MLTKRPLILSFLVLALLFIRVTDSYSSPYDPSIKNTAWVDSINQLSQELLILSPEKSLPYINTALTVADSLGYTKGYFIASINKGGRFWMSGLYDQALKYYYQADAIQHESNSFEQARLYNNIAETYKQLNNYDSADTYYLKALAVSELLAEHQNAAMIYFNRAELYYLKQQRDSALELFHQSLELAEESNNDRARAYSIAALSQIAYDDGDLENAINLGEKALVDRMEQLDQRAIVLSHLNLAKYYFAANELSKAEEALTTAYSLSRELKAFDLIGKALYQTYEYYQSINEFEQATDFLKQYSLLSDSLNDANSLERIASIRSALESELTHAEIQLLREQQERQKQTLRNQISVIISSILIVIALIIILYFNARTLRKEKTHSAELNKLNEMVKMKNAKIEQMNLELDKRLMRTSQMLIDGQKTAKLGSWEYIIDENKANWTEETARQLGMPFSTQSPDMDQVKEKLGETQFERIREAFERSIENKEEQRINVILSDDSTNSTKVFSVNFIPQFKNGKPVRVYGSNHDITERFISERVERQIIQSLLELTKYTSLRSESFEEFIERLLISGSRTMQVDRASFWIYDHSQKSIQCYKLFNKSTEQLESGDILYEKDYPIYFSALREDRTLDANDILTDPRTCEFVSKYAKITRVKAMLDARVSVDEKLIGIVCFERTDKHTTWSLSDQRYVGSLTDIIANAYSSFVNKRLEKEKISLINELVIKNQNLKQFAYLISHNLRGPATKVIGLADLFKISQDKQETTEIIEKIGEAANSLDAVIKDLAMLVNSEDEELKNGSYELIQLDLIIERIKKELNKEIAKQQASISLKIDDNLTWKAHQRSIYKILTELIKNALIFSKNGTKTSIVINIREEDQLIKLTVSDNGLGLDMVKYGHKLFKIYQRFHLDKPGRGLGLYMVKNLVEQLGGQIHFVSDPDIGTQVTVSFPMDSSSKDMLLL